MKRKIYIFCILVNLLAPHQKLLSESQRLRPSYTDIKTEQEIKKTQKEIEILSLAKYNMINGNLDKAEFLLNKLYDGTTSFDLVKKRYLAIINFIKERYDDSLSLLSNHQLDDTFFYKENCLLKTFNYLQLDELAKAATEHNKCKSYTLDYSKNNQMWLDNLFSITMQDNDEARQRTIKNFSIYENQFILQSNEIIRTGLKIGLYNKKNRILESQLNSLPQQAYYSKKIRELTGFIHYRLGNYERALDFIEDINSANAENLRGNIYLYNNEYELAWGHFQLALQKNQLSSNALNRSIPLSLILQQWDKGEEILSSKIPLENERIDFLILKAMFQIYLHKYKQADKTSLIIESIIHSASPPVLNLMNSYLSLILEDKQKLQLHSTNACLEYDGLNCWMLLQQSLWQNIGKTIKRSDKIYSDKHLTIDSLKQKVTITPFKEMLIVDQEDIEQLDSAQVRR